MNPDLPLRDIHLPDGVSWWPIASGWWLLLVLVMLIAMVIWAIHINKARGQLRKQALAELEKVETDFNQHQDAQQLASDLSMLLRRVCISRFPRADVAGLTGQAWLDFLNAQTNSFNTESADALLNGPFQKQSNINSSALINACRQWVEQLQPVKGTHT